MICRLCLTETEFGFPLKNVEIQANDEETEDKEAIIRKHIDLPLDISSDFVCDACWQKISEFHAYYMFIEEKQKERSQEIISTRNDEKLIATGYENRIVLQDKVAEKDGYGLWYYLSNECLVDLSAPMVEATLQEANERPDKRNELIDATEELEATTNFHIEPASCDTNDNVEATQATPQEANERPDIRNELIDATEELEATTNFHIEPASCDTNTNDIVEATQVTPQEANERPDIRNELIDATEELEATTNFHIEPASCDTNTNDIVEATRTQQTKTTPTEEKKKVLDKENRDSYDSHLLQVHPEGESSKIQCTLCPATFVNQNLLHRHRRKLHRKKTFKCDGCDKKFKTAAILRQHVRIIHMRAYETKCDICGKSFSNSTNCNDHKARIHQKAGTLNFQCPHCPQKFALLKQLNKHKNECHDEQNRKCNECGKEFKTSNILKAHTRKVHLRAYIAQCDICGKTISKSSLLNSHKSKAHGMEELSKFQCPLCPRKFTHKFLLNAHTKDFHSEQALKCDECGKIFKSWNCLKQHARTVHSRVYAIECDICSKTFAGRGSLKKHKAMAHAAEENMNFQCPSCPKKFADKSQLKQHKRVCQSKQTSQNEKTEN